MNPVDLKNYHPLVVSNEEAVEMYTKLMGSEDPSIGGNHKNDFRFSLNTKTTVAKTTKTTVAKTTVTTVAKTNIIDGDEDEEESQPNLTTVTTPSDNPDTAKKKFPNIGS